MISDWSERRTRIIQGLLALGWVLVIASLFWPLTYRFTDPHDPWALPGWTITTADGVAHPYPIGLRIWWNIGIPALIVTVLVLGHDAWRRICPLSFFAQIPRRLGFSRTLRQTDGSRLPALVTTDSWWAKHALLVQFSLLWVGLSARLVITNSNPLALAIFIGATLLAALVIGLRYGGKTWCHYVCPMAPVQFVYAGPRGLLSKPASLTTNGLSQSMCRLPTAGGDVSACVACNAPCPDIDLERHYWERSEQTSRRIVVYGYLGLVLGFLAQQEWQGHAYNATAFWYDQTDWSLITAPGWIIGEVAIPVPRWLAAPLMLAACAGGCMGVGLLLERWWIQRGAAAEQTRHRLMIASAVIALAVLLWTRVVPGLKVLPPTALAMIGGALIGALSVWASRGWQRTRAAWQRDSLATSLRRRLAQAPIDLTAHLGGRRLEDLSTDEIHLLAQVAGAMDQGQRRRLYREVLGDLAASGQQHGPTAEALLSGLRRQLGVSDEEHQAALMDVTSTGAGDQRLRLCRTELERLIVRHLSAGHSLHTALAEESDAISELRDRHGLSDAEFQSLAAQLVDGDSALAQAAQVLARQVAEVVQDDTVLATVTDPVIALLRRRLDERGRTLAAQMIAVLEALGDQHAALAIAKQTVGAGRLAPSDWRTRLPTALVTTLDHEPAATGTTLTAILHRLCQDDDPLVALLAARGLGDVSTTLAQRLGDDPRLPAMLRPALSPDTTWQIALTIAGGAPLIVNQFPATLGREAQCTIPIQHRLISHRHATLERRGDALWLRDGGSTNGTLVDHRWVHGDAVRLTLPTTVVLGGDGGPQLGIARHLDHSDDPVTLLTRIGASRVGSGLPTTALIALASAAQRVCHNPGTTLITAGQTVTTLRIVLEGIAVVRDVSGREVGRIGPGETMGELGLIAQEPASATVTALTGVMCAELSAERFRALLSDQPGVAQTLLVQVGQRLINTLRQTTASPATAQTSPANTDLLATIVPH